MLATTGSPCWRRQDANVELEQALEELRCEAAEAERMEGAAARAEASGLEQQHDALRVEISSLERLLQSVLMREKRAADERAGEVARATSRAFCVKQESPCSSANDATTTSEPIRIDVAMPPVAGEDGKACIWCPSLSSSWLIT